MYLNAKPGSVGIACFVKTPKLSPIKTRLASSIGEENALKIYGLMLDGIRKTFKNLQKIDPNCFVYWAVAEQDIDESFWSDFPCLAQGDGELGDRLDSIYGQLLHKHKIAVLIGADCPLLTTGRLFLANQNLRSQDGFLFGPAQDGGFYLFGGNREIEKKIWKTPVYSSSETKSQLKAELVKIDSVTEIEELFDIDEYKDLLKLLEAEEQHQTNEIDSEFLKFIRNLITHH